MAEFLHPFQKELGDPALSAMAMMGRPISFKARQVGYNHCIDMGLSKENSLLCVNAVSEQLQRNQPYEAMVAGMKYVDLTGTYRLFAALLVAQQEEWNEENKRA